MESTRVFSYNTQRLNLKKSPFKIRDILINIIGFMLGRATILSGLSPFGLAFYVASFTGDIKSLSLGLCIIVGLITAGLGIISVKYIMALILFTGFYLINKRDIFKNKFFVALICFSSLFFTGLIPVILQGLLLYDLLMLLFECFVGFIMVLIFQAGLPVIKQHVERRILTNEEMISLSILLGLVILGFIDIPLPGGVSLKNIMCILIILIFSLKNGIGIATSTGVTLGLINSMATPMMPILVGSYAFCGLISGVFRSLGKVGISLGFILANTIFTIYVNGSSEVLINIYDILIAVAIFSFIPTKALDYVGDLLNKNSNKIINRKAYSQKIRGTIVEKLGSISASFEQLANTFNHISQKKSGLNTKDVTILFDQVADQVCKDCGLCLCCWEREFHNTYQVMFNILETLEEKGRIYETDIPEWFSKRCIRIETFVNAMNNMFEIYKVNLMWTNKVGESRGLVSQQLQGVAKIITNLAEEITIDLEFDDEMEKEIMIAMDKIGMVAKEITVLRNSSSKYEVDIIFKSCGGTRKCIKNAAPIVSKVIGRKMVKENMICSKQKRKDRCVVKFREEETYQISTGISQISKKGQTQCGDSYSFMQLKDGKYVLTLSDGMGSGKKALKESSATIALLEQFLDSGFDKDTAVKLINSVLVLKSPEESFSTIDLSAIDLQTGNVEFAKIGAASTFIKKQDRIEVIKSTSLPVGILSNIDMEISSKKVNEGDFIIMMSDGVLDANKQVIKKEAWLKDVLCDISSSNPQEIADQVLKIVLDNSGSVEDDMTVLVAKVWKKVS